MMQSQWPGAGPIFEPSATDPWGGPFARPGSNVAAAAPAPQPDGLAQPWWPAAAGAPPRGPGGFGGIGMFGSADASGGSLSGLIGNIIAQLQSLIGGYLNGGQAAGGAQQQQFSSLDVSSTGDPHLAATGTRPGNCAPALNERYDSMTAHTDLVDSADVAGGYRVSTAVTQPDANGVTWNRSATVHANDGADRVTMNRDGSFVVVDDGEPVQLAAGQSLQLSGGSTVTRGNDGALTIAANGTGGGTIATTLRANGNGVDVTTHAQNIAVGGDVVNHDAPPALAHGHHQRRYPQAAGPMPAPAATPTATVPPAL